MGGAPKQEEAPAVPPPLPAASPAQTPTDAAQSLATNAANTDAKGFAGTLATTPLGSLQPANTTLKTLTGQ